MDVITHNCPPYLNTQGNVIKELQIRPAPLIQLNEENVFFESSDEKKEIISGLYSRSEMKFLFEENKEL